MVVSQHRYFLSDCRVGELDIRFTKLVCDLTCGLWLGGHRYLWPADLGEHSPNSKKEGGAVNGTYYYPKKKENTKPVTISTAVAVIALACFLFVFPGLFGDRCSWSDTEPVPVVPGVGQMIGPVHSYSCQPPIITIPEPYTRLAVVVWLLMLPISAVAVIVGIIYVFVGG